MNIDKLCGLCGGILKLRTEERSVSYGARTLTFGQEYWSCTACDESFFSAEQLVVRRQKAISLTHSRGEAPLPFEIRALRQNEQLDPRAFADLLGGSFTEEDVLLWEKGQAVPPAHAAVLLRALAAGFPIAAPATLSSAVTLVSAVPAFEYGVFGDIWWDASLSGADEAQLDFPLTIGAASLGSLVYEKSDDSDEAVCVPAAGTFKSAA